MAIVNRDDLIARVGAFGDDDNVIGLLEDITDTIDDYERRIAESGDWETKYNSLDADWRSRYRARFLEAVNSPGGGDYEVDREISTGEVVPDTMEIKTYEDLFEDV